MIIKGNTQTKAITARMMRMPKSELSIVCYLNRHYFLLSIAHVLSTKEKKLYLFYSSRPCLILCSNSRSFQNNPTLCSLIVFNVANTILKVPCVNYSYNQIT